MREVVHIAMVDDWREAEASTVYAPASLDTEGFIHCSERRQLERVLRELYAGRDDLILLVIDVERLEPEIRWDPVGADAFPHIYGPLNLDAVIAVEPVPT